MSTETPVAFANDPPNLRAFKSAVYWFATLGGFTWAQVAEGLGMTEAQQRAILNNMKEPPPEQEWRSRLTLMAQQRAAVCEQYLNSRGIVTDWHIWPTRWEKDVPRKDRPRTLLGRAKAAFSLLGGAAHG